MPTKKQTEAIQVINGEMIPLDKTESLAICHDLPTQVNLLTRDTPNRFLKNRLGRGGKVFTYVDIHFVTAMLNAVFFLDWNWEILSHEVDKTENQVIVKGRLTVKFADGRVVVKEAFGSSEVKRLKTGDCVDLADDLKGAASDGLKKAASLLGIAADVYAGQAKAVIGKAENTPDDDFLGTEVERPVSSIQDKEQFKTITLSLANGTSIKVSKFEALEYFGKIKAALGEEIYRATLQLSGFNKSNEIPPEKVPQMYTVLVNAFRSRQKVEEKKDEA